MGSCPLAIGFFIRLATQASSITTPRNSWWWRVLAHPSNLSRPRSRRPNSVWPLSHRALGVHWPAVERLAAWWPRASQGLADSQRAPCRDFILGMTVMDAEGQLLRYGGTVMKNVAGYDVSRLHTGAMGILGLIIDVAIKVLPEPAATATVALPLDETAALERVNAWSAEPLPLSATAWTPRDGGCLWLRF